MNRALQAFDVIFLIGYIRDMDTKPKRKRGGQPKSPDEKLVAGSIRLKPSHWAKLNALGLGWLRAALEQMKI